MAMQLDKVIPFGRSLDEYKHMFALSPEDIDSKILSVADGPASVNAEMFQLGKNYFSVDPLYRFSAEEIEQQFHRVAADVFRQVEQSSADWVWTFHRDLEALQQTRIRVMKTFVSDLPLGIKTGRYRAGELPQLDFADRTFDLILCSHFLFLYSAHFSYEFHRDSIIEMLRVADEVRIFPLLTLNLEVSPYLAALLEEFRDSPWKIMVEKVPYELQKGGNQMLKIGKLAG